MKHAITFLLILLLIKTTALAATPTVSVTIKPIHSLISSVTHGVTKPILLIDNTLSIHDYILKPSDARKLEASDIIFYVDDTLESFVKNVKGKTLIKLSDQVTLLPLRKEFIFTSNSQSKIHDTHVWLNPDNAKKIVRYVSDILGKIDRDNAELYRKNAELTLIKIDSHAYEIIKNLANVYNIPYLVTHDAYQYFEKYFHLTPIATLSLGEDISPNLKTLGKIKKIVSKQKINCIFSESEADAKLGDLLSDHPITVQILDPIGSDLQAGPEAYFAMMTNLSNNFKKCLENK